MRMPGGATAYAGESRAMRLVELREALLLHELVVYYQPVVAAADGALSHVEALVRWQHPQLGLVLPDEFIPLAEENGLITEMTCYVLRQVLQQLRSWNAEGFEIAVAVNASARSAQDARFPGVIAALLHEHGVPAAELTGWLQALPTRWQPDGDGDASGRHVPLNNRKSWNMNCENIAQPLCDSDGLDTGGQTGDITAGACTVFLVDDQPDSLLLMRALLDGQSNLVVVGEATGGHQAIASIREASPQLAIIDVEMPGMNGFEAAQRLKAAIPDLQVIMVSTEDKVGYDDLARAVGTTAFLSKKYLSGVRISSLL